MLSYIASNTYLLTHYEPRLVGFPKIKIKLLVVKQHRKRKSSMSTSRELMVMK